MNGFVAPEAQLLPALEARARAAGNLAELGFSIANDSYRLLPFRQALVFSGSGGDSRLLCVSGLAKLSEESPYLVWLRRTWFRLQRRIGAGAAWLSRTDLAAQDDVEAELLDGWARVVARRVVRPAAGSSRWRAAWLGLLSARSAAH